MSYSYEQQRAYTAMQWTWNEFEIMKDEIKTVKCPEHHKRAWVGIEWERDYNVDVSVYRYCCLEFAEIIKKRFTDRGIFDSVRIDPYEPKKRAMPSSRNSDKNNEGQ